MFVHGSRQNGPSSFYRTVNSCVSGGFQTASILYSFFAPLNFGLENSLCKYTKKEKVARISFLHSHSSRERPTKAHAWGPTCRRGGRGERGSEWCRWSSSARGHESGEGGTRVSLNVGRRSWKWLQTPSCRLWRVQCEDLWARRSGRTQETGDRDFQAPEDKTSRINLVNITDKRLRPFPAFVALKRPEDLWDRV